MGISLRFPSQAMEKNLHAPPSQSSGNTESLRNIPEKFECYDAKTICIYSLSTPYEDSQKCFQIFLFSILKFSLSGCLAPSKSSWHSFEIFIHPFCLPQPLTLLLKLDKYLYLTIQEVHIHFI